MKQKTDEKQLLADAKLWFEQRYGKSPKECGIKFIKIWHKPTPLFKKQLLSFLPKPKKRVTLLYGSKMLSGAYQITLGYYLYTLSLFSSHFFHKNRVKTL